MKRHNAEFRIITLVVKTFNHSGEHHEKIND